MSLSPRSPRLPSPPPTTEIQVKPESTSIAGSDHDKLLNAKDNVSKENSSRRIHPGTRSANMAIGPPVIPIVELDSAFQLQEHLKALHYDCTKSHNNTSTIPISRANAHIISEPPTGADKALWLYELCRLLINKCNDLIVGFLFDTPPCSASTCPEMRASEWQFLCAVHESPKSCCAIDYCCHTLDWATNIVTSQKIFPSRLSLGQGDVIVEGNAGVRQMANIFRRLHRIFAHAWFQHRQVYWSVENSTGLYTLFKIVCDKYDLMPAENYKLPPEAEGLETVEEPRPVFSILKSNLSPSFPMVSEDDHINSLTRNKTRRHIRQSPSVGSAVTTVLEADEDDTVLHGLEDLNPMIEIEVESSQNSDNHELGGNDEVDSSKDLTSTEIKHIPEVEQVNDPVRIQDEKDLQADSVSQPGSENLEQLEEKTSPEEISQVTEDLDEIKQIEKNSEI